MRKIIDITKELFGCEPYPGDPAPERFTVKTVEKDGFSLTAFYACAHNSTHMDAPSHFLDGGGDITSVALEKCVGKCYVSDSVQDALLALEGGYTRILLKGIDIALTDAERFAEKAELLGMDGASFGEHSVCGKVHRALLARGVALLEHLDLSSVENGDYTLIALPLKLAGSDGSPVRAVLVKDE